MKINKLEQGMRGIFVEGKIVDISETREVSTRYGPRLVADATLEDNTGKIKLSLWEDMIEKVNVGDEVSINGAYVTEFRNELQLNIARSGKLEVKRIKPIQTEVKKKPEVTQYTVHDRLGADEDLFMVTVHEAIGWHISYDEDGEDASGLKADLEELVETCPRCNKEEGGKGALKLGIDGQPYNICRTHFSSYLGGWPFSEHVKDQFDVADPFFKRKFRGLVQTNIEHKIVLVKSKLTRFKKDESWGSVWRYFNDRVVKALGGRWVPSQNGWIFHEDKEWVDGEWRLRKGPLIYAESIPDYP